MVDYAKRNFSVNGTIIKEGDWISLNGSTGEVYLGKVETEDATLDEDFTAIMNLAEKYTRMYVRTNADTPKDRTYVLRRTPYRRYA